MFQTDKILIACPPSACGYASIVGAGDDGVLPAGENGVYFQDLPIEDGTTRRVVYQYITIDPNSERQTTVQMHLRRSSVMFVVLDGEAKILDCKKQITRLSAVCAGYNRKAPCIGPNVTVHLLIMDRTAEDAASLVGWARLAAAKFAIDVRATVFGACVPSEIDGAQIDFHSGRPSIPRLSSEYYHSKPRHWRRLPAIRSGDHEYLLETVRDVAKAMLSQGDAIVESASLINRVEEFMASSGNSFLRYDIDMCLDALDKEGAVRLYSLSPSMIFLDAEFYPLVVRHVVDRVEQISNEEANKIVPLEIDELPKDGVAADYLSALELNQRRAVIQSLLGELISSRVLGEMEFKGRQYIVKPLPVLDSEWPAVLADKFVGALANSNLDVYAKGTRFAFYSDKRLDMLFCAPRIRDNKIEINALFSSYTENRISAYYNALHDPKSRRPVFEDYWGAVKSVGEFSHIRNSAARIFIISSELKRISALLEDFALQDNLDVRISWRPIHNIMDPNWNIRSSVRAMVTVWVNITLGLRRLSRPGWLSSPKASMSQKACLPNSGQGAAPIGDNIPAIRSLHDDWAARNSYI